MCCPATAGVRPGGRKRSFRLVGRSLLVIRGLLSAIFAASVALAQPSPDPGREAVFTVLLDEPSVGERLGIARAKGGNDPAPRLAPSRESLRSAVALSQDHLIRALKERGIEVVGSARSVLNAVFVRASTAQAEVISAMPGVSAVQPGRRYEPMLRTASEIVRVAAARVRPPDTQLFGDGLKIAIIDSGLDFRHVAFEDTSLPAINGYPVGDPQYLHLASPKVVAVRSYVESLNSRNIRSSTPDDNSPWDSGGHGTAVAMIAAGKQVATPIGLTGGIAPKARIGVYKVFGSPGLNFQTADHAVIMAIDDAVEDGMDILNLSLGNPTYYPWGASGADCGRRFSRSPCDPLSAAAQSAVEDFGRVVVVAAGNFGLRGTHAIPVRTTINSPGDAPAVITVGQTLNGARHHEAVRAGSQTFAAASGTGPDAEGPLTAPAILASDVGDSLACEPFPDQAFLGGIAVVDRSECFFVEKVENADAAGAAGVLVINHEGDDLVEMALLEDTDIPAFFVGAADGASIREALAAGEAVLTLDPTPVVSEQDWNVVAPASSRGPTLGFHPKPDLVAPGDAVYTAAPRFSEQGTAFSPSGFRAVSGTSFASPVVAGAAALVWEAFPTMSAREVASALINSAQPLTLEDGAAYPLSSAGAGMLDVQGALSPTATVVPSSLGFGPLRNTPFPVRRQIAVRNKSSRPQSYMVTVEPDQEDPNARVTINGRSAATFRLGPHATIDLSISLGGGRPLAGAYEGRLRVRSLAGSGDVLVPYLYIVPDSAPFNAIRFQGHGSIGLEGEAETRNLVARVLDQFGAPVAGRPVVFRAAEGEPSVSFSSPTSGTNGLIFATARFTGDPGPQTVVATIGDLEIPFSFEASGTKPAIQTVSNSASQASPRGLAAGSLVTIRGGEFSSHASGPPTVTGRSLPILRKGVAVAFDAPEMGVSVAGRIHSVDSESVVVQVPWELAGLPGAYVSVRAGNRTDPFEFQLATVDPGIFHYDVEGQAYAMASHADGTSVTPDRPAAPGEAITLLMTGNGPVQATPGTGEAVAMPVTTVCVPSVQIGGLAAQVTYSGLAVDLAGLYQVTAVLPDTLPAGDHPILVTIEGAASNQPVLPVRLGTD